MTTLTIENLKLLKIYVKNCTTYVHDPVHAHIEVIDMCIAMVQKQNNELKPCPFCNSEVSIYEEQNWSGIKSWNAYCPNEDCPMENVWASGFNTKEEVIAVWNDQYPK